MPKLYSKTNKKHIGEKDCGYSISNLLLYAKLVLQITQSAAIADSYL